MKLELHKYKSHVMMKFQFHKRISLILVLNLHT